MAPHPPQPVLEFFPCQVERIFAMCLCITWTNAKDVDNILGKKYIAICEQNDPIVSRLVRYLDAVMRVQRSNRMKAISATAAHHNLPIGVPPSDEMPINVKHFPHDYEKEYNLIWPIMSGTATKWKWQVFSGFLATLNDAGFPRTALYKLLRKRAEDHDLGRILTAEEKSSFTTLANRRSTGDAPRPSVALRWKRGKGKEWDAWQLAYQQSGIQSHVTVNDISYPVRYIDRTEVDWWMEREKIIVPKDFQTATSLLDLKRVQIWNFAHNLNEIKSINQCWQNILIFESRD